MLAFDNDGDIYLSANGTSFALNEDVGTQAQVDVLRQLRFPQGEWVYDTSLGTPYFQEILVKNAPLSVVRQILVDSVLTVNNVVTVESVNFTFPQREFLNVDMRIVVDGAAPLDIGFSVSPG